MDVVVSLPEPGMTVAIDWKAMRRAFVFPPFGERKRTVAGTVIGERSGRLEVQLWSPGEQGEPGMSEVLPFTFGLPLDGEGHFWRRLGT